MNLLLIEDDANISAALRYALTPEHALTVVNTGADGLDTALANGFDVILLDLCLPDIPGAEICKRLRAADNSTPLLVLTGELKPLTKITLLDMGADDYLTKPFSLGELKARLRALTRRSAKPVNGPRRLMVGDLTLDPNTFQAKRANVVIQLRRKEFTLLECLMERAGSVVTRDTLSAHAWGSEDSPWANTLDVHIKYLRDKIDRPFAQPLITTVHGIGYKLELSRNPTMSHLKPNPAMASLAEIVST